MKLPGPRLLFFGSFFFITDSISLLGISLFIFSIWRKTFWKLTSTLQIISFVHIYRCLLHAWTRAWNGNTMMVNLAKFSDARNRPQRCPASRQTKRRKLHHLQTKRRKRQKDISQLYKSPCNQEGETLAPINRHSVKTQFAEEGIKLANTWRDLFLVRLHHRVRSWCHPNKAGMWEGGPSWRWWGLRRVPHSQGRGGCMVTSRHTSGTPPSHIMMWTYRATWETVWKMKLASYPPTGSVQVNLRASIWGNVHTEPPRRMSWRLRCQMKMSVIFEVGKSKCL